MNESKPPTTRQRRKRWMSEAELVQLYNLGLTYKEIGEVNRRKHNWRPTPSAVSLKLKDLGVPPRRTRHVDLLPWKIRPEHRNDRLRHYLRAWSKKQAGRRLSDDEQSAVSVLDGLLFGRGRFLVVGYHPEVGFFLAERLDSDDPDSIIRAPAVGTEADAEPVTDKLE